MTTHWKTMRQQFDNLASRLTVTVNEVQARMESGRLEKDPAAVALGASVRVYLRSWAVERAGGKFNRKLNRR